MKLFNNSFLLTLLSYCIRFIIDTIYYTTRFAVQGKEKLEPYLAGDKQAIYVFWHGRLLLMPKLYSGNRKIHALISTHRDGEIIAKTVERFNCGLVRGSSRRGGRKALVKAMEILSSGDSLVIVPDGPKGPRMRAKGQIIHLARNTNIPIIPVTYSIRNGYVLSSWDRFLMPYPFSKGIIIYGEPMFITEGDDQHYLSMLEHELNRITILADQSMGREIIEPEPIHG